MWKKQISMCLVRESLTSFWDASSYGWLFLHSNCNIKTKNYLVGLKIIRVDLFLHPKCDTETFNFLEFHQFLSI